MQTDLWSIVVATCMLNLAACMPGVDEAPIEKPPPQPKVRVQGAMLFSPNSEAPVVTGTISGLDRNGNLQLKFEGGDKEVYVSGRFDRDGNMQNDSGTLTKNDSVFTGAYRSSTFISGALGGSLSGDIVGFLGATTELPQAFTSGAAVFRGESVSRLTVGGKAYEAISNDTSVSVDLASRRAVLSARNLQVSDGQSPDVIEDIMDEFQISNILVGSQALSAGNFLARLKGNSVKPLGSDAAGAVDGRYYGQDGALPDEVSGSLTVQGSDGSLIGLFATD